MRALRELDFALSGAQAAEIVSGKDFVQLKSGPFDLDLVLGQRSTRGPTRAPRRGEVDGVGADPTLPAAPRHARETPERTEGLYRCQCPC